MSVYERLNELQEIPEARALLPMRDAVRTDYSSVMEGVRESLRREWASVGWVATVEQDSASTQTDREHF
jgi:hypothetical protein